MTALEQFCKQKDNVIWMYFSINFYGLVVLTFSSSIVPLSTWKRLWQLLP